MLQAEFEALLKTMGIKLSVDEFNSVFRFFDRDESGSIDAPEFYRAIRGELEPARRKLVEAAFDKLDQTKDGRVTLADLKVRFMERQCLWPCS